MVRRTRSTTTISASRVMTMDELASKIPDWPASKGGDLKHSTAKGYTDCLRRIARDLKGEDNVIKLLEDFTTVDDYLQAKNVAVNTLKKDFSALNLAAKLLDLTKEAKEFYNTKLFGYMKSSEKNRKENLIPEKFGEALPKWSEIADIASKFDNTKEKHSMKHAITALYTLTYPRRLEYFSIIYLKQKPTKRPQLKPPKLKADKDEAGNPYNYVYEDKDGLFRVVLGSYKTDKKYGIFQDKYSQELSNILAGYVKKRKIKNNEYLLMNQARNKFKTSGQQSNAIKSAFASHYDKFEITLDNIRHIWTTSLHDNEFKVDIKDKELFYREMTSNEKEDLAELVGHSVVMSENYRQIKARPQKKKKATAQIEETPTEQPEAPTEQVDEVDEVEQETIQTEEDTPVDTTEPTNNDEEASTSVSKEALMLSVKRYYDLKFEMLQKKYELLKKQLELFA